MEKKKYDVEFHGTSFFALVPQRQIVKDFLIKFTKKVPEAPYGS